ncbi:hypothetical protein EC919_104343 [Pseudomonas graminis]|uniref:hypothetical protein n=1 Tax=Pseudomonas graminis TaxID=158627 RepID=UPI00105EED50|nr:hypothetical protein [Pseudomonas graminis]TDV54604.1 hypothetical protein EC919_104343 [Pseudomonas graminis]
MLELLSLKDLCEALVSQQFESVHDAEQALEKFEHLTTPAAVLSLLNDLERLEAEVRDGECSRDASVSLQTENLTRQEQ